LINPSNNKLFSIIDSFSKVELNRLSKFIESPYFNANQDISTLYFQIIKKYNRGLEFTKAELWSKMYHKKAFNSLRFRKLFSDLLKLTEQFLTQEVFQENELEKANYLLKSIGDRNLKKLYSTSLTNATRISKRALYKESSFYYYQYQREKNIYELKDSDLDRSSSSNLEQINNNLDYFYLAEKMRYLCEMTNREDIISMEYDILFRDEIMKHLNKYKYDEVPLVSIYYHMYLTLKGTKDNYFKLKELLEKHIHIFPAHEAKEIYTSVINYCIKQINSGDEKFLSEFIELNEILLAKNIIAENELSPWRFKNIITAGLKLTKFEWVENFIDSYKDKIPEQYRENAITFNTAQLYFFQKKYEELLPLLLQVEYEDFTYSLSSKLITCISYFELDEIDALLSFVDSFKIYLNRKRSISDSRKKRYLNFISHIKKLIRFKFNRKKIDLLDLKNVILDHGHIAGKEWLLEKIDELLYLKPSQRGIDTNFNKGANT